MAVKERVGLVVSDKMDKTVVVAVENRAPHPKYRKIVVQTKRYKVHDEENKCQVGDRVRIQETRPLSRTKRWTVISILGAKEGAETVVAQPEAAPQAAAPQPETSEASEVDEQPDESSEAVNQSSEPDEQGEEQ
jgi:small subunit ribosomal protein S17